MSMPFRARDPFRSTAVGTFVSCAVAGTLLVGLLGVVPSRAQDAFRKLVDHVPRSANAVVILNVEKILSSPLAVSEGWKENLEKSFDSGLVRVPPDAARFVIGAQLDLEFMEPIWEVALADMAQAWSTKTVIEKRGGTLDSVGGLDAVALPDDRYLVQFAPETLGAMAPGNRQLVWRWLQELKSGQPLSPYLSRAAVYSDDAGTDIILAVDLEGVLSPDRVGAYVKAKELPKAMNQSAEALTELFSGIRGVRLGIKIGSRPSAALAVDFSQEVSISPEGAKALMLGVLEEKGMSISDLADWRPKAAGSSISLQGYLSEDGLRRVLSVIDSPAPAKVSQPQTGDTTSPGDLAAQKVSNSLEYFRAITTMFDDLKKDMKNSKNLASTALWFDKYAKRIDRLPILNTDEELLDYGEYVTRALRAAAGSVRTMGIRSGARGSQITSVGADAYAVQGGYRYGGYGRYGWGGGWGGGGFTAVYDPKAELRSWDAQLRAIRGQERGKMAMDVNGIRDQVVQATSDIRRKMTEKYQVEF
jgi:hypothetical protein